MIYGMNTNELHNILILRSGAGKLPTPLLRKLARIPMDELTPQNVEQFMAALTCAERKDMKLHYAGQDIIRRAREFNIRVDANDSVWTVVEKIRKSDKK